MKNLVIVVALAVCSVIAAQPAAAQDLKQKLAAAKEAAAKNAQAQRAYTWLEKTELSFKGEVKNTKIESCRYGPDGKVVKTAVVTPPPAAKQRGLKAKVVAKKTEDMKDDLEAAVALVQQYVPPSPDKMQAVMTAGTASAGQTGAGGALAFTFPAYQKPGDTLTITFDAAVTTLRQIAVATWLDKPDATVTLNVTMQSSADGLSYPGVIALSIPSSHIDVRITKSNYQKLAQ
jgi:hypothetical protein